MVREEKGDWISAIVKMTVNSGFVQRKYSRAPKRILDEMISIIHSKDIYDDAGSKLPGSRRP